MTLALIEPLEDAKARWVEVLRTCENERDRQAQGSPAWKAWDDAAAQAKKMLGLTVEERTLYWKRQEVVAALKFEKDGMTTLWQKACSFLPQEGA